MHHTAQTKGAFIVFWELETGTRFRSHTVADPGFVKRGGRESKFPARPEKVAQWGGGGGDSDTFFPRNFLGRHLHYWVGVPSAYQTDLRGGKQKKKKKKCPKKFKSSERRGGRGRFGPPLDPPLSYM